MTSTSVLQPYMHTHPHAHTHTPLDIEESKILSAGLYRCWLYGSFLKYETSMGYLYEFYLALSPVRLGCGHIFNPGDTNRT